MRFAAQCRSVEILRGSSGAGEALGARSGYTALLSRVLTAQARKTESF